MRMTHKDDELEVIQFVEQAALFFGEDETRASYGDLTPGSLLALRYGSANDCVLVLRLDEYAEPINFQNATKTARKTEIRDRLIKDLGLPEPESPF